MNLMVLLCRLTNNSISSGEYDKTRVQYGYDALNKQAQSALDLCENVPESIEVKLLGNLANDLRYSHLRGKGDNLDEWISQRKENVRRRLYLWNRLSLRVAKLESTPVLPYYANIATEPSKNSDEGWVAGMDPKAIKDPVMRANYEAALAENKRRANDAWNRRYWSRITQEHLRNLETYSV